MKAIERFSITDEAVKRIQSELLSGRYKVGDRLATERELSEQLGVGRSTVREALKAVRALGFVEIRQGKGVYVRKTKLDTDDSIRNWFARHEFQLTDFLEVRAVLEPLAVRLAIERATTEEIAKIGQVLQRFGRAMAAGSVAELASSDQLFHSAIAEATHNKLIVLIDQSLAEAFRGYRMHAFAIKETASDALVPHQRIFDAIRERNPIAGMNEMVEHLRITLDDIHKVVAANDVPRS